MASSQLYSFVPVQKQFPVLLLRLPQKYILTDSDYVAQWVYPHILGLAYLRYHKTVFPVSSVCISELMTSRGHPPCESTNQALLLNQFNRLNGSTLLPRDPDVDNVLEEAIKIQGRRGAFGAYTISTLLILLSF